MKIEMLSDVELAEWYARTIKEMKRRGIIRTNNVVGELGEHLAIMHYQKDPKLPKLSKAPVGTQNFDAISRKGESYSIKSTTNNITGVFYGLNEKGSTNADKKIFDYVIICKFDNNYSLKAMYEIDWDTFIKHKKWHSRMKAWNLTITKKLIMDSKIIYTANAEDE